MELGTKIKMIRRAAGLSQSDVEARSGLRREYIGNIENNINKNPTLITIVRICNALEINLSDVFDEDFDRVENSNRFNRQCTELCKHLDECIECLHKMKKTINVL
jgi:transcriptional regulator with XRE-family HTH domain